MCFARSFSFKRRVCWLDGCATGQVERSNPQLLNIFLCFGHIPKPVCTILTFWWQRMATISYFWCLIAVFVGHIPTVSICISPKCCCIPTSVRVGMNFKPSDFGLHSWLQSHGSWYPERYVKSGMRIPRRGSASNCLGIELGMATDLRYVAWIPNYWSNKGLILLEFVVFS